MKKILNFKFISVILLSAFLSNCDNKDDATGYSNLEVASDVVASVSLINPLASSQTVREADANVFTYKITINKSQPVDIHVSVSQNAGTATDDDDFKFDKEVIIPAYSTIGTGTISILNDNLQEGDETFTLKIGSVNTSNAVLGSSLLNFTIKDCFSNLAGTFNYSTTNCSAPTGESASGPLTGTVTFAQLSSGLYSISDASFGGWVGLYGASGGVATGVKLSDLCGTISFTDKDQYNEVFTMTNLVINGPSLSFHWENDYGEYGDTTLTRTDGTNWPQLTL
jgi:hypothetical protein